MAIRAINKNAQFTLFFDYEVDTLADVSSASIPNGSTCYVLSDKRRLFYKDTSGTVMPLYGAAAGGGGTGLTYLSETDNGTTITLAQATRDKFKIRTNAPGGEQFSMVLTPTGLYLHDEDGTTAEIETSAAIRFRNDADVGQDFGRTLSWATHQDTIDFGVWHFKFLRRLMPRLVARTASTLTLEVWNGSAYEQHTFSTTVGTYLFRSTFTAANGTTLF